MFPDSAGFDVVEEVLEEGAGDVDGDGDGAGAAFFFGFAADFSGAGSVLTTVFAAISWPPVPTAGTVITAPPPEGADDAGGSDEGIGVGIGEGSGAVGAGW